MTRTLPARGVTIVEAVFSMAVVMIGAAGLAGMHTQSQAFLGDSLRLGRATAVAQDLMSQVESWDYTDPRLANASTANDADLGDVSGRFLTEATPPFDHREADLTAGGAVWNGLGREALESAGMERYWNVSYVDDANGNAVPDAVRVAVIVRWPQGGAWRRVVFVTAKVNPGDVQ
jgi:hypothetical protein